jgi:hypothetical protein
MKTDTTINEMASGRERTGGSSGAVVRLFVVEYEHGRKRYHTVIEACDLEAAKLQFRRDNPNVEMLSCV